MSSRFKKERIYNTLILTTTYIILFTSFLYENRIDDIGLRYEKLEKYEVHIICIENDFTINDNVKKYLCDSYIGYMVTIDYYLSKADAVFFNELFLSSLRRDAFTGC